ncbi:MAG: phosphopantetheine-binding protein, partial [Alphaproteobacteria bacterium]
VEIAAVVPRRNAQGLVDALALHVATSEAEAIIVERLRHALAQALPAHMVPARMLVAAALPLTPTGKVDRLRLAELDSRRRDEMAEGASEGAAADGYWPDPLASRVAGAIADEARIEGLAPQDDLNTLGVDSLLAINIALRIEKQWGVELDPLELLSGRTVGAIVAGVVEAARP